MKLQYLLLAAAGLGLFTACESEEPSLVKAEYKKPTTFVLNTPQFANGVYELKNANAVNLTFSQPDYGYSAVCDYTVELSSTEDFKYSAVISSVYHECDIDVNANDFAMALCTTYSNAAKAALEENPEADVNPWLDQEDVDQAIAASADGTIPVYVRINAKVSNPNVTGSEITSNAIKLNTVPYFALPEVELPAQMYMIGQFCGWDWANAAEMVPVHSNPDKFWCIRYVKAGEGFKFNFAKEWNGTEFGGNATLVSNVEGVTMSEADGNITVDKDGWYIFGTSTAISGRDYVHTVTIFPANVYVFGDTNGGSWEAKPEWLFTIPADGEGDFVSPALVANGELRLCIVPTTLAGEAWAGDWWHTEFIFFDGKIAYRGTGGDQERVQAVAGQVCTLNFVTGKATLK